MDFTFKKAIAHKLKLKLLIMGEAGTGKTWWSLAIGTRIAELEGGRVAFIDTEGADGKAQLYAPYFDFDHLIINDHSPETYQKAIHAAITQNYSVVIVDSFTQEWNGKNGVLEITDREKTGWAASKPRHRSLIHTIHDARIHIIGTVRAKTAYGRKDDGSIDWKTASIEARQEPEFEYEWDMSAILDHDHHLTVRKSRCFEIPSETVYKSQPRNTQGDELTQDDQSLFAYELYKWMNAGDSLPHWTENERELRRVEHWMTQAKEIERFALNLAGAVADTDRMQYDTPHAYIEAIKEYCSPAKIRERAQETIKPQPHPAKTIQLRPLLVSDLSEPPSPRETESIFGHLVEES